MNGKKTMRTEQALITRVPQRVIISDGKRMIYNVADKNFIRNNQNKNTRLQNMRTNIFCAVVLVSAAIAHLPGNHAVAQQKSAAGAALSSMFNVQRAPKAKSMGLFQANFLDSLKSANRSLQLAVVIDSTESMSNELAGIRTSLPELLADLYRIQDGALETTVVAFSDVGQSERPVKVVSPSFVREPPQIAQLVEQITLESGKPYFPESVDLGVYTAIDQLDWSAEDNVEKWMLLIGDAPPYDPSFFESETQARRWYETDFLVDLANKKSLKIHCLLCASRENEKQAYEESLIKTRRFMSRLADGTGGQMLDLSYPFVRQRLVENATPAKTEYKRIGYITQTEIDQIARQNQDLEANDNQVIRIVVLPFLPLESITFFFERPEVQIATQLRQSLRSLPNVRTIPPRQVEDQILRLQGEGVPVQDWPQALNIRLRADYVLHGSLRMTDSAFAEAKVFGRDHSEPLIQLGTSGPISSLAGSVLSDLKKTRQRPDSLQPLLLRLKKLEESSEGTISTIAMLQDLNPDEHGQLLGAFEALQQALDYSLGDVQGEDLLNKAEAALTELLTTQPEHAFAHTLLASCQYNQAKIHEESGRTDEAKLRFQRSIGSIKQAYRLRSQLVDRLTRFEVEADHALMVAKDYASAIESYEQIVNFSEASPVQPALRAHWMLAGIYNGAWDVAKHDASVVDSEKAKRHLVQILAYWPESVEAAAIKRFLLWDEKKNRSRTPYLPIEGDLLTSAN